MQLEEEMRTSGCSQGGGRTTMRHCGNYGEPGYNTRIYKKDEETSNVYSSDWFQLIFDVVMDLFEKEDKQCEKVADSLIWPTRLSSTLYNIIIKINVIWLIRKPISSKFQMSDFIILYLIIIF